ncbi:hypothetical protein BS78_03G244300 [Paspalum vaginatum]|nr:hypothetical protein BS78_03G244300 [Paspalum vaginatum]
MNRNAAYNFLINKFRTKLTCLKVDTLSHAGRLVYINSVLASIPIYYMTNILLPKDLLEKITAIIRNFCWKGQQNEGKKIYLLQRMGGHLPTQAPRRARHQEHCHSQQKLGNPLSLDGGSTQGSFPLQGARPLAPKH